VYDCIEIEALNFPVTFVFHELNFQNVNRLYLETYCLVFNVYCHEDFIIF